MADRRDWRVEYRLRPEQVDRLAEAERQGFQARLAGRRRCPGGGEVAWMWNRAWLEGWFAADQMLRDLREARRAVDA